MAKNWVTVQSGRIGPLARTVQYLLSAQGYAIAVDGEVGPQTIDAIKAFQSENGLTVDGIVGNQTWPELIVEVGEGDQGDAVSAAQDQLSVRDLPETRNLTVDGVFGPLTTSAVRALQTYIKDNQSALVDEPVVVDGVVGINTWYCFVMDLGPLPE